MVGQLGYHINGPTQCFIAIVLLVKPTVQKWVSLVISQSLQWPHHTHIISHLEVWCAVAWRHSFHLAGPMVLFMNHPMVLFMYQPSDEKSVNSIFSNKKIFCYVIFNNQFSVFSAISNIQIQPKLTHFKISWLGLACVHWCDTEVTHDHFTSSLRQNKSWSSIR